MEPDRTNSLSSVEEFYNANAEYEWDRLGRHRMEFAVTRKALLAHLPPAPARILDCGGGPGRYAVDLAQQGYKITLFDLSAANLALASQKAGRAGVSIEGFEQGTATDLSRFSDHSFDAVLLMGPLYHLFSRQEREKAITEARRVLKPGGLLFAAFISRYAAHRDLALREPNRIVRDREVSQSILTRGILSPANQGEPQFTAYFAHPVEVEPLFWSLGFEVLKVLGVEGLVSMNEAEVNKLEGEEWQAWVNLNYQVAADPTIHGCVEHLLAMVVKPAWRSVLAEIALKLEQAELRYRVVGGASAALNGVSLQVKDIDIEMDAGSALKFERLLVDQIHKVILPAQIRENEKYKSVFGRYDIGGVTFEIMGDLQRREGDRWVPSAAQTENLVDLDGTFVRVSTLEEETLAYMRRGRLDRAAQCLPLCNPEGLRKLLLGETRTEVL